MRSSAVVGALLMLSSPATAQDIDSLINHSFIAFTIPEKDLLPENVAYDPVTRAFFVGSTRKGKIVRVGADGSVQDFITPRQDGLWMVIGMKVDAARRHLWVASSGGGNLLEYRREGSRPAGIFKFDLTTGQLQRKWILDERDETHFFNDLVLTAMGDVFITHMFDEAVVYVIRHDRDTLEVLTRPENFSYPNGITLSDDGHRLFMAHDEGISALDPATGARHQLGHPDDVQLEGIDGLYYHRGALIAIHPGRQVLRRYHLDATQRAVVRAETLEANHPMFNNPTTGVVVGDTLYYIANAQFGMVHDGALPPLEQLYEVVVLKVGLGR